MTYETWNPDTPEPVIENTGNQDHTIYTSTNILDLPVSLLLYPQDTVMKQYGEDEGKTITLPPVLTDIHRP